MVTKLKLSGFQITFPLGRPLEQCSRFQKWLSHASKEDLKNLFASSMQNEKVLYRAATSSSLKLSPVVEANLRYLAKLAGYDEDLFSSARKISEERKITACPSQEIIPSSDVNHIQSHRGRNNFGRYDGI